jgi:hypothetical protein
MRATTLCLVTFATLCAPGAISCASDSGGQRPAQAPPPYAQGPGPYGAPPGYAGQNPYAPPSPYGGATPAPYGPPTAPTNTPPPSAPVTTPWNGPDPIATGDARWLRGKAGSLMQELESVLPDDARRRVQSVPLVVDDTPGEVNAFAACVRGSPLLSVSDGLLDIAGHLAAARANDDVFRTRKVDEYIAFLARYQKPKQPIPEPPPGFFDERQATDPNRIRREQEVLDETLGFVIGHELGHHRLGHLPCTGAPGLFGIGDVARGLSSSVPLFNQPNELAADAAGTNNLLVVGSHRPGYHLTEGGGLLLMQFFAAVDQMSPEDILFSFDQTHPPAQVRVPVIQQTANFYRLSGGWLPIPGF